jgi:hypothetical protein
MHSGKRFASVTPMSSLPAAAASIKGVSKSLFRLTISSSWPCSMRNSWYVLAQAQYLNNDALYSNLCEAISRSKMQARIAFVFKVGIAQSLTVVSNDALHKREIIEEDSAAQTPGYVNPKTCLAAT